jgi:hypothetical protein
MRTYADRHDSRLAPAPDDAKLRIVTAGAYRALPDGRKGWYQRAPHECLRAAMATLLEIPYDETLDIEPVTTPSDEFWSRWNAWARDRGLEIRGSHEYAPAHHPLWLAGGTFAPSVRGGVPCGRDAPNRALSRPLLGSRTPT